MTDNWQRLAEMRIPVRGFGLITVAEMLERVSASDIDPTKRNELARELWRLVAALSPLPPAKRDAIVERIAEVVREVFETTMNKETGGVQ